MALWHSINSKSDILFNQISLAKFTSDSTAFLMCGGPSLNAINPELVKGLNRTVFAMNNVYPYIKPDIWIGMDVPECYSKQLFWESFIKILKFEHSDKLIEGTAVRDLFNTYFLQVRGAKNGFKDIEIFTDRKNHIDFIWQRSTFITALQLIVWMGFNKIYLFGCDFNNSANHYYNDVTLKEEHRLINSKLYDNLDDYLKWFSKTSKHYGIEVYSCSPDSKINKYLEYKNYKVVITDLERKVPHGGKLLHSHEAYYKK